MRILELSFRNAQACPMIASVSVARSHRSLGFVLAVASSACSFDTSVPASGASDAEVASRDGSGSDGAAPNAPDAFVVPPDVAVPPPPDASGGTLSFQEGLGGYVSTVDTYLNKMFPDVPQGALSSIKWEQDEPEHGLLRFDDIFGLGPQRVPPGASIMRATLTVVVFDESNGDADLREAAVDWSEATTLNSYGGDPGVQSDEMHPEVIATIPRAVGSYSLDVTESLVRWADSTRTNQGWIFVSKDDNDQQIWSSEYTVAPQSRPLLAVEYFWP